MRATCNLCGNTSNFDKESLKGSTVKINGCKVVMCVHCEDEMLVELCERRNIGIKLDDGGELLKIDIGGLDERCIKLADGYKIVEE